MFRFLLASLILVLSVIHRPWAQAPAFSDSGFVLETVATLPPHQPVGLTWGPNGAMYVWQDNGVVRVVKDGKLLPDPFIDLRPRVNSLNDRGLLGLALDPDFAANGYVYLLYTYAGKGDPNDSRPMTSRLTRVIADPANRHVAVPNSETVILGSSDKAPCLELPAGSDCIGSDSHSHSVGTLRFGKDGKLLVSIGDGASFNYTDTLALRAQDLNRYEGKILRIN
nr:PQQ-dependent sugar dehydrogenase [Fibrobacterota bacterium]